MTGRGEGPHPMDVAPAWASSSSVPEDDGWLSPAEREVLAGLRFPKRIRDWRVGRWVAKHAVLRALGAGTLSLDAVEILASPGGAPSPRVLAPGSWGPVSLSLSHSGGVGFAVAISDVIQIGRASSKRSPPEVIPSCKTISPRSSGPGWGPIRRNAIGGRCWSGARRSLPSKLWVRACASTRVPWR